MKKVLALILVALLALTFVACTGDSGASDGKGKVGISMPTKSLQRWNQDGDNLKSQFEAEGFVVDLQYAASADDVAGQVAQVENMITGGCDVLIIAANDSKSFTEVLATAKDQNISVFAYDRLIENTDAIDYYVTFDNVEVGREQGRYIEKALDLANAEGPFNMEIFTGSPDDTNAFYFYQGAMEIMKPYIDSGVVVVPSGQVDQMATATAGWSREVAQNRMDDLISSNGYSPTGGTKLDAVLCSNDSTAQGAITALTAAGYDASNIPVITGQDADKPNVTYLLTDLQAMAVFKDTRTLAAQTVKMVIQHLNGETVETNDSSTYNNGVKVVDSYLCKPVACTKADIQTLLFDSGYYSWDDPELADAKAAAEEAGII